MELIGKINYPAREGELTPEYSRLYAVEGGNRLAFRLINKSGKTLNAYRVEIVCKENGAERKYTVNVKNLEIETGCSTEEAEVLLPAGAEEGEIIMAVAIYEDLSHNDAPLSVPFASFDTVSRVADAILSGAAQTSAAVPSAQTFETAEPRREDKPKDKEEPEMAKDNKPEEKSRLPLALALSAVGGFVLTFIVYAINLKTLGGTGSSYVNTFQNIMFVCLFLWTACVALSLSAIAVRKKNRSHSTAVVILGFAVLAVYLWFMSNMLGWLLLISTLVLSLAFGIVAIVKKDRGMLIGIVAVLAAVMLIFAGNVLHVGACSIGKDNRPDDYEGTGNNTPATTAPESYATTEMQMVLEFTSYGDGTCYVSGVHWSGGTYVEPSTCFDSSTGTLTIPAYSPSGDRVRIIGLYVFSNDQDIKKVVLPNTITRIAKFAFENCNSIEEVVYQGTTAEWHAVNIEEGNDILTNVRRVFNDGSITPASTTGE